MDEDSTANLSGERLARLLKLVMEQAAGGEGTEMAPAPEEALARCLSRELSLEEEVGYSLPAVLGRSCSEMGPCIGRTLGEVLMDPETDVAALETLRDYGETLVSASKSKVEQAAATAVYYAAIAAALVFHGQNITRRSYPRLDENLAKLERRAWIFEELRALFRRAQEICRQRTEEIPESEGD